MKDKTSDLKFSIGRLKNGLDKIVAANREVNDIQIKLAILLPELEQANIDTEAMIVKIGIESKEAD